MVTQTKELRLLLPSGPALVASGDKVLCTRPRHSLENRVLASYPSWCPSVPVMWKKLPHTRNGWDSEEGVPGPRTFCFWISTWQFPTRATDVTLTKLYSATTLPLALVLSPNLRIPGCKVKCISHARVTRVSLGFTQVLGSLRRERGFSPG